MGACVSTQRCRVSNSDSGTQQSTDGAPTEGRRSTTDGVDCKAFIQDKSGPVLGGGALRRSRSATSLTRSASGEQPLDTLLQVHELQNALAAVSDAPGLGLSEAAELLHAELDADLIGIYGFCRDEGSDGCGDERSPAPGGDGWCAVLLASYGYGESVLDGAPVVTDPCASPLRLRASAADCLSAAAVGATDGAGGPLPADWSALASACGLRSFLAVPIGPPSKPWGALLVAKEAPHGLAGQSWRIWTGVAAVALVHQLRHWQTATACDLMRRAAPLTDRVALIGMVLRCARAFMERACNARAGVRLAVLDGARSKALLFELGSSECSTHGSSVASAPEGSALVALEMGLQGTLLSSAVHIRKARFVRDCTSYMQSSAHPARDVFTQPSQLVASLVVVPLIRGEQAPIAALYLTLETPNDFALVQAPLLGFINMIVPLMYQKLEGHLEEVWSEARAVRDHLGRLTSQLRSADASSFLGPAPGSVAAAAWGALLAAQQAPASGTGQPALASITSGSSSSGGEGPAPRSGGSGASGCNAPPSQVLASCNSKRLCTSAMIKAVEQEIFKCKRLSASDGSYHGLASFTDAGDGSSACRASACLSAASDLLLSELIGAGGYGSVWKGSWKKVTAAVKVMYKRTTEQEAMMDAVEMAVLSAVSHPHVTQMFACLTDMVEVHGVPTTKSFVDLTHMGAHRAGSAESAPPPRPSPPHYRRLLPFEDPGGAEACSIIVMEYCDLGTLRRAAQRGLFHRPLPSFPNWEAAQCGMPGTAPSGPLPAGSIGVDMAALVEVALEVAEAVAHLHSIRLCHCDIKLDNVLLKSEVSQPRGYIVKLADYGLAKVLGAGGGPAVNVTCAGTVTHLAPELFTPGSRVTPAVDAYAFGVLLYELYMGGASAYAGLSKAAIIERVAAAGMRPRFPSSAPREYAAVARACWAADPAARPAFPQIIARLQGLLDAITQLRAGPLQAAYTPPVGPVA